MKIERIFKKETDFEDMVVQELSVEVAEGRHMRAVEMEGMLWGNKGVESRDIEGNLTLIPRGDLLWPMEKIFFNASKPTNPLSSILKSEAHN